MISLNGDCRTRLMNTQTISKRPAYTQVGYKLSYKAVILLFTTYATFMIIGLFLSILGLAHDYVFISDYPIIIKAIIGCFGISMVGSSIFYSRKLYKHSISTEITFPVDESDKLRQVGIFMYFLLRPLFAICFATLIILILRVSILVISVKDQTLEPGFIYLSMFLSFFAGFSTGDILGVLEELGRSRMEKFFGKTSEHEV